MSHTVAMLYPCSAIEPNRDVKMKFVDARSLGFDKGKTGTDLINEITCIRKLY